MRRPVKFDVDDQKETGVAHMSNAGLKTSLPKRLGFRVKLDDQLYVDDRRDFFAGRNASD